MSPTSQPVPFRWQLVDQRLSSILQSKVSEEIRKLINDDVGHIRFQNMHNGNSMTVPSERLQMHRRRVDEWAARLYEGYCEIWQTQRKHLSPEFLRGIVENVISVMCSARVGSVTDEFVREQQGTGRHANRLKPSLEAFKRDMQMLAHKWKQAAELDAETVQYMLLAAPESSAIRIAAREVITARARTRTLEFMIASIEARIEMAERALNGMLTANTPPYRKSSVEQSLSQLKDKRKELRSHLDQWELRLKAAFRDAEEIEAKVSANLTTAARETPDAASPGISATFGREQERSGPPGRESPVDLTLRKSDSQLIYQSALKRAIMARLIRKPDASDLDICHDLDLDGEPLPTTWKIGEVLFFESAYRDPRVRPRIQTAISKVRADLRRNRVIR